MADPSVTEYAASEQQYQLFTPAEYAGTRPWPLLLWISPGDAPQGWRYWETVCRRKRMFFCAPFAAGNSCDPSRRCRLILDVLDDVRRKYVIDPNQTYIAAGPGSTQIACSLSFSLPELNGGANLVQGGGSLPTLPYLRNRLKDRLSIAMLTDHNTPACRECELYYFPYFHDLGIRSRLWESQRGSKILQSPRVLEEVIAWLADDLDRRHADGKRYPKLTIGPQEAATDREQADRLLSTAKEEILQHGRIARGAAMLEGILKRWPATGAAEASREQLALLSQSVQTQRSLEESRATEDILEQKARMKALERLGDLGPAWRGWQQLAARYPGTLEGDRARKEALRLAQLIPKGPYLGLSLQGSTLTIARVVSGGPADRAGLRRGDRIVSLNDRTVSSQTALRELLASLQEQKSLRVAIRRDSHPLEAALDVETRPLVLPATPGPQESR